MVSVKKGLKWSKGLLVIHSLVTFLMLLAVVSLIRDGSYVLASLIFLLWMMPALVMPYSCQYKEGAICLQRLIGKRCFDTEDHLIYKATKADGKKSCRTFGVYGLFAIYGWFYNRRLGDHFRHTVSDEDLLLLISKKNGTKYLINCPPAVQQAIPETFAEYWPGSVTEEPCCE